MYLFDDLKKYRPIDAGTVACPVDRCSVEVERQTKHFRAETRFTCPTHGLVISPSTFQHVNRRDNYLGSSVDLALLDEICQSKRETRRLGRERSEDAVTFNVFRPLERLRLLDAYLTTLGPHTATNTALNYWSFSQAARGPWAPLLAVSAEFGERHGRGSEPDLVAITDDTLYFIEVKMTSGNETKPSDPAEALPRYANLANRWFRRVFVDASEATDVAVTAKKYELMRYWLLGTRLAQNLRRNFVLVSLVPEAQGRKVAATFRPFLREEEERRFVATTWEALAVFIEGHANGCAELAHVYAYLRDKTAGYNRAGSLQRAFQVERSVAGTQ